MSTSIRVLDEAVINRIAAGEVVERPVSVVKELVENSIDAHAGSIQVDIELGGRKLVRVRDDGDGMSHDDAFLALERHATSKLSSEKDLVAVATLGFRGEALASIASVSRMKLVTSDGSDPAGAEIVIEGGVFRNSQQVGAPRGTLIEVRNLFFNVPVRRKFLKKARYEGDLIQEFVTKIALAFPEIALTYREDGRVKFDAPPVKTTLERISTLFSRDVRDNLIEVDHTVDDGRLHGYVARPPYGRSNMRSVQTFVNGRAVKDRLINSAVTRAFSNLMERGRYPLAILFVELPPEKVDVNVHPQKAEVRFTQPKQVFDLILDGIYEALVGGPFRPPREPKEPLRPQPPMTPVHLHVRDERPPLEMDAASPPMPDRRVPTDSQRTAESSPAPMPSRSSAQATVPDSERSAAPMPIRDETDADRAGLPDRTVRPFSSLGVLGALPNSFLILYSDDELIVMDHHAAHERVLFEGLKQSEQESGRFETQNLLIPTVLEFQPLEARAFQSHLDVLAKVGFSVEEFGENDFAVKGVPGWLGNTDLETFFHELIDVMLDTGVRGDPERLKEELLKQMACKAAVKETSSLQPQEIKNLLADLDRIGSIEVCPHGRPITARVSLAELRRKMGRK
jgi:DNA mismatch repair protein MutL